MATATLIERVAEHARQRPDAVAVADADGSLSYAALVERSRALGAALEGAGVAAGDLVAIALAPGSAAITALLATHATGAAFFFVDRSEPPARTRALLAELQVRQVVAASGGDAFGLVRIGPDERATPDGPESPAPAATSLAYVVATSGSSGAPKGVRVGHGGLLPMLDAQIGAFGVTPTSRVLLGTPLCFDASLSDIGTALASGASLHVPPRRDDPGRLATFLERAQITHADVPPAMLALLGEPPPCVEVVVVGGEVVAPTLLRRWAGRVRVVVSYGPTEATVCTSLAVVDPEAWHEPSIGQPLAHVRYRVATPEGDEAAPAQPGELWISGSCLALGYVARPALERERFVLHEGARWYRTGDRVRRRADGHFVFEGRLDRERKLRGRRVCPEEIEAAAGSVPGMREIAVVIRELERPLRSPRATPVAFAVIDPAATSAAAVRHALTRALPAALVPRVEVRASLPRTASGKIDLAALEASPLPGPAEPLASPGADDAPAAVVARAMAMVLALPTVAPDDDFFVLGGDSLAALELVVEARLAGLPLGADAVTSGRTPRAIAARARPSRTTTSAIDAAIAPLRRELAAFASAAAPPRVTSDTALFTGATGEFGPYLLASWLARGTGVAVCLVRAASDAVARERLARALDRAGLPPELHARTRVVRGDVTRPMFGLDEHAYAALATDVAAVVHAATDLDLGASFEVAARTNVRGAFEAARLACTGPRKPLHLVSSVAVLLASPDCPTRIDEATPMHALASLHGGYAASKWAAERVVAGLLPCHVHRLGLLCGAETPRRRGTFAGLVRGLSGLGCYPEAHAAALRLDVTPIGRAADALATLLHGGADCPAVCHIAGKRGVSLEAIVGALSAEGVALEPLDARAFARRARRHHGLDEALAAQSLVRREGGESPHPDLDPFLLTGRELDGTRTQRHARTSIGDPTFAALRAIVRAALAARAT